jgi:hypothetical protein
MSPCTEKLTNIFSPKTSQLIPHQTLAHSHFASPVIAFFKRRLVDIFIWQFHMPVLLLQVDFVAMQGDHVFL